MGSSQASEFASAVTQGNISLNKALHWHLTSNHYPPLPSGCLALAKEAIDAIEAKEPERLIDVSSIGSHKRYGVMVPAWECVAAWHLWGFIRHEGL